MNTKTAEEKPDFLRLAQNKYPIDALKAALYMPHDAWKPYVEGCESVWNDHVSPLKKRIEELEAQRDHFETLYKQGLVIIDTLNTSNHGK